MYNQEQETINYLTFNQAEELVERIANRAENFNYTMCDNEKEAMASLLSDIGVQTSDLIDVSNLADNYAINAEIITQEEADQWDANTQDALFSWVDNDTNENTYCMQW